MGQRIMKPCSSCFFVLTIVTAVLPAALPVQGWDVLRRSLQTGAASDWTREAQRNLSRWEARLLRNTLARHYSSHVLGEVPFDLFNPIVTCPPPSKLMRLDPDGPNEHPTKWLDGAKWMCVPFPRTARPGCVVLSFGSNEQFEFERAALDMTPCTVHTLDCTTGMLGNATHFQSIDPDRHSFHPYCVGGREMAAKNPKQVLTWEGIMRVVRPEGTMRAVRKSGAGAGRMLRHGSVSGSTEAGADDGRGLGAADAAGELDDSRATQDGGVVRRLHRSDLWGGLKRGIVGGGEGRGGGGGPGGGGGGGGGGRRRRVDPGPEVFLLKIDVEGYEWPLLSEWGPRTPGLPTFLAIEIHNWLEPNDELAPPPPPLPPPPPPRQRMNALAWWLYGKRAAERAGAAAADAKRAADAAVFARRQRVYGGELSLMFLHLARLGYAVAAREDNPNGDFEGKLCCSEFLFIRVRGPEEGRSGGSVWINLLSSVKDSFRQGLMAPLGGGGGAAAAAARRLLPANGWGR